MTLTQAKTLAAWYVKYLGAGDGSSTADYIIDFAKRLQEMPDDKVEKGMRWLGFIQGVLWVTSCFSIDDMKRHSRLASEGKDITL